MTSAENTYSSCCLKSFKWDGSPTGKESTLSSNPTYITGSNPNVAVLFVHDALGWTFSNARLLADHFAREVGFLLPKLTSSPILQFLSLRTIN